MGVRIAILDSGVKQNHPAFRDINVKGFSLRVNSGIVEKNDNFSDNIGHGTGIFYLINSQVRNADIYNIKIFDTDNEIFQEDFEKIMEYLYLHYHFDIINLSMGFLSCGNIEKLHQICNNFSESGTIIISAFNNDGAVSFPAALNNVIGVDSQEGLEPGDYIYVENSIINVIGSRRSTRIAWIEPDYIFAKGASFTCANFTAKIANHIAVNPSTKIESICWQKKSMIPKRVVRPPFQICRAAVFPFNKEIHAIARFEEMLAFEIVNYYAPRISGFVGKRICDVLPGCNNPKEIKNIEDIEWSTFDTMIIGHNETIGYITGESINKDLVSRALKEGKNIFSFDPPGCDKKYTSSNDGIYFPCIDHRCFTMRFGKLYRISRPVLCVIGTNSRQGKFSLQLILRQIFQKKGFNVGQFGTEPSSLLFGFDCVFPCGYNGLVKLDIPQTITAINEFIWEITQKDPDIVIAGCQSGLIPYNDYNALAFTSFHQIVFSAIQPDAIIVCINPYDDIEFIKRTIMTAEGISGGKVIGIVCYPLDSSIGWRGQFGEKHHISKQEEMELREKISQSLEHMSMYMLDSESDIQDLVSSIIDFFQ